MSKAFIGLGLQRIFFYCILMDFVSYPTTSLYFRRTPKYRQLRDDDGPVQEPDGDMARSRVGLILSVRHAYLNGAMSLPLFEGRTKSPRFFIIVFVLYVDKK